MRYAVIGGDVRMAHLVSMLKESGREAEGFLQDNSQSGLENLSRHSVIISNWPMRWPLCDADISEEDVLGRIAPGSVLLMCGPGFPKEKRWDLQYINLWQDENLLRENAYLTAEGAAASAMRRTGRSMAQVQCAVVGYGRIGRCLAEILRNESAQVTVLSRTEEKRRIAKSAGLMAADLSDAASVLPGKDWIFTTPPAAVLDEAALRSVDRNALLMDLASPPYGFDLDAARELGLQACREPGLPGRYCPLSAARVIFSAVIRWEERESNGEK